jgi:hypothetical protein
MQSTSALDAPMRKVISTTLKSDRWATFETVLGQWRLSRHQILEAAEETRLADLYRQQRSEQVASRSEAGSKPWWHVW